MCDYCVKLEGKESSGLFLDKQVTVDSEMIPVDFCHPTKEKHATLLGCQAVWVDILQGGLRPHPPC